MLNSQHLKKSLLFSNEKKKNARLLRNLKSSTFHPMISGRLTADRKQLLLRQLTEFDSQKILQDSEKPMQVVVAVDVAEAALVTVGAGSN